MKKILLLLPIVFLTIYSTCFALEKSTHEAINELIADGVPNSFSLSGYLNKNLGFSKGKDEIVNGQEVYKWLRDGGKTEDEPFYTRSVNHFLDPLTGKGFKGDFKTALEWAKNQSGIVLSSDCSWGATRGYYRQGLTSSTKTERETKLAGAFECVGRLMHLVQDMSVPAHTRDDGHVGWFLTPSPVKGEGWWG